MQPTIASTSATLGTIQFGSSLASLQQGMVLLPFRGQQAGMGVNAGWRPSFSVLTWGSVVLGTPWAGPFVGVQLSTMQFGDVALPLGNPLSIHLRKNIEG